MRYLIILLLLTPLVFAQVTIYQVLYDPINSESGGEAIELKNDASTPIDISGWIIASESSSTDATIPDNILLMPGETYLIADEGWDDSKDNPDWRSADYEEKITLANSDSGIALIANNTVIDAVGWGDVENIEDNLYESTPFLDVSPGMALTRLTDTNNNEVDFIESVPDFFAGIPVPITSNIAVSFPSLSVSRSLNLNPEGVLSIKNNGNAAVSISLIFNDFHHKDYTISKNAVNVEEDNFVISPGEERKLSIKLNVPEDAIPGLYTSTLRVIST